MNYTFTLLNSTMSIGDTVDIINSNYDNIKSWVNSIQLSADSYWKPFVDFYKSFIIEFEPNINNANANLDKWKSTATTIETNSANWVEPLILYYPYVIKLTEYTKSLVSSSNTYRYDLTTSKLSSVTSWLNNNFPVLNNEKVSYLERTKALIHLILNVDDIQVTNFQISDSTTCSTSDTIATGVCTVHTSGQVTSCNKKTYSCGGSFSCNKSQSISCFFENGSKTLPTSITANLKYNFDNNNEINNILTLEYVVKNCLWEANNVVYII